MKVSIVGAGPVGSYLAYLLASQGAGVHVYEEHGKPGFPIQCTGIVTADILRILPLRSIVDSAAVNRISAARIHAGSTNARLRLNRENIILDRAVFDSLIFRKAEDAGARFFFGTKVLSVGKDSFRVRFGKGPGRHSIRKFDVCVGADGPLSVVSGYLGNSRPDSLVGAQAVVRMRNDNHVDFYLEEGGYRWVVPEGRDKARVGIAAGSGVRKRLLSMLDSLGDPEVIAWQAGVIPFYDPKIRIAAGNIYIVGDAATQLKATTGGGIIPGLLAAECLARAILEGRGANGYRRLFRARVGRSLLLHLKMRQAMDRMGEDDLEDLVRVISKPKVKRVLEAYDRENPFRYLFRIALAEPGLLRYVRFLRSS